MGRTSVLWLLAVVVTVASVVYQRTTGPTYPVRGSIELAGQEIKYKLLRTHHTTADAVMAIEVPDAGITGRVHWKRFKSYDTWTDEPLRREGSSLLITIPVQPSAGKVIYRVYLSDAAGTEQALSDKPVVIRFKDPVPGLVLVPHIVLMFMGLLLAMRAGLEAAFNRPNACRFTVWTSVLLFVGGLIFGPIVQKYAFGTFYAGWPLGHDLTDTKTVFGIIFWLVALWRARRPGQGRVAIITAAVVIFLIYLVPHSVLGSEIDYTRLDS